VTDQVQIPGYKLLRTLGEGGMATVYLAVQESLDREVALKVMSPVLAANETFCEQFMKEGRITAKLTHPHLMTVHDIGSYNGVYYLASEFLPAGTLRERMDGLSTAEALEIARDIASGLAYAHEKGFVHRDVKPGNIMFRSNGTAVLADFGIAKAMKSMSAATMAGNAIGTPDYMSPEQAQAIPVDGRSDLYSLGAVLFETLTGSRPYEAPDAYAIALMHVTEPVPRLTEKQVWLQPLIDGLMAKNPDQRFASGEAFITACDRLVQANPLAAASAREQRSARRRAVSTGVGSTAASAAISQSAQSAASKRGLRLALLGAGVVVLIIAIALGWRWTHSPADANATVPATVTPVVQPPPLPPVPEDAAANAALAKLDLPTLLARGDEYLAYGQDQKHYGEKLDFPSGDNAIELFQEALKREPGNARAVKGLAEIAAFYGQGAHTAFNNGLYAGTEELVEKGLRADPKNAQLLKLKADLAQAEKGG
jgi:serine/threonine-protein kinase PpkA